MSRPQPYGSPPRASRHAGRRDSARRAPPTGHHWCAMETKRASRIAASGVGSELIEGHSTGTTRTRPGSRADDSRPLSSNSGRRRPGGGVRGTADHDPDGDDKSDHERQPAHRHEAAQPDRERSHRLPSAPDRRSARLITVQFIMRIAMRGEGRRRGSAPPLALPTALRAHGRVVRRKIREARLHGARWPSGTPGPLEPAGPRRSRDGGAPGQLRGELDRSPRPGDPDRGATGVVGHQAKPGAAADGSRVALGFPRRVDRDGARAVRRDKRESAHENLLEHTFDEHMFDTVAADRRSVQSIFEHMFEVLVIPP